MTANSPGPWTVLRLLNWTKDYFARGRLDEPRLSAEILLSHVLVCKRIDLYTRFDYQPSPEELRGYRQLVSRAIQHEPVAYIVGWKEFYSLRLKVTPDVLVPRSETEILVAEAVAHLRELKRQGLMWDICTGSGCVAIAVAANVPNVSVLATDVSKKAVAAAAENTAAHELTSRVRCRVADLLWLPDDCSDMKDFDVITANPPYVADNEMISQTVKHEPPGAVRGGPDGLDFIRLIVRDAPRFLGPAGALIMEFGFAQADGVRNCIGETDRFAEPRTLTDHQGIERSVVVRKRP